MSKGLEGKRGGGSTWGGAGVAPHSPPPIPTVSWAPPPPIKPPTPHKTPHSLPLHDADGRPADGVVEAEAEEGAGGAVDPPGALTLMFGVGGTSVTLTRGGPSARRTPVAFPYRPPQGLSHGFGEGRQPFGGA